MYLYGVQPTMYSVYGVYVQLTYIQFISKASIANCYRREIFTVMFSAFQLRPPPSAGVLSLQQSLTTISDLKIEIPERVSGAKITIWIGPVLCCRWIDDQIIVNKQKCVDSVQPTRTMAERDWKINKSRFQCTENLKVVHEQICKISGCCCTWKGPLGTLPILFFIVGRITIKSHIKGCGERIQFLPNIPAPTRRRDPWGDLDGVLELTLVCRLHILHPYIHTYENMTYPFYTPLRIFCMA